MDLEERMRGYEVPFKPRLFPGLPAIIRLDMRCGRTFCKHLDRPFDTDFAFAMERAMYALCTQIPGAILGYTQSDEINIAVRNTVDERDIPQWFGGNVVKIASVTASICTTTFQVRFAWEKDETIPLPYGPPQFDSRVFNVPNVTELHNYFVWRQRDAERNSLNMLAQSLYTPEELAGKKRAELIDMCLEKGWNWNRLDPTFKQGSSIYREEGRDWECTGMIFSQMPKFIPRLYEGCEI